MFASGIIITLTNIVIGIIELLLGLRLILLLLGANPSTPFVAWIYETSGILLSPFQGIFPTPVIEGRYILDVSALVALVVYAFIGYLIITALGYLEDLSTSRVTREEVVVKKSR